MKLVLAVVATGLILAVLVPWLQDRGTAFYPAIAWVVVAVILAALFLPDVLRSLRRRP